MGYINYTQEANIGTLTINRPEALNALNTAVTNELLATLGEIEKSDIRCLIITGAGEKSFIAGADIAEMKDFAPQAAEDFSKAGNLVMDTIESLPMPVIAAVNGFALGGGCELAMSCDIRIASDNAVFSLPEASLGILPGYGGVQRLARIVGLAKAKELAFTTNRVKAEEAKTLGLVNQVVAQADLMAEANKMASKIATNAPVSVRAIKTIANNSAKVTETRGLEVKLFAECFDIEDQFNAMDSFVNKKEMKPFTGKKKG